MSDAHNYGGLVVGGPLDGKELVNNASKGFVAVDLTTNEVHIYDYAHEEGTFVHQYDAPLDEEKLGKAQEDGSRSVLALNYPEGGEAEDIPEWDPEVDGG